MVPREAVNPGPDGHYVYVVTPDGMRRSSVPVKVLFDDGVNDARSRATSSPATRSSPTASCASFPAARSASRRAQAAGGGQGQMASGRRARQARQAGG